MAMPVPPAFAVLLGRAEANLLVGGAVVVVVLQRDEEAAGMDRVGLVVPAAPRVEVERPVGGDDHLARVADMVGEDGGAEALRQGDPGIVAGALAGIRRTRGVFGPCGSGRGERQDGRHGRGQEEVASAETREG